ISSPPRLPPIGPPSSSHLLPCSISPTAPPHFTLFILSFPLLLPLISTGSPPLLPPSSAGFSRHQLNASPAIFTRAISPVHEQQCATYLASTPPLHG
ncbi:unnamed protein product, partial [Closterium sp. Naga37s-1]